MSPGIRSQWDEPESIAGPVRYATLPNLLSLIRVLFLVPVLLLLHQNQVSSDRLAVGLLFIAGITDLLDGWLARTRGSVSPSGKVVDPVADKILIGGLVIYLVIARDFPLWMVIVILARDLALVLGGVWLARREAIVLPANRSGKVTTFTVSVLILVYVLDVRSWIEPMKVLASVALGWSIVSYGVRGWRLRNHRLTPL